MKQYLLYRWLIIILIFISLQLLGTISANGEGISTGEPSRAKIGLALGSGAAGGFAQIGILKWLEENHIPIDGIAGTSMGGLLGACYAMGMSPLNIENLVKSTNWGDLFNPLPPYDSLDFRRKEDEQEYPISGLGLRDGKLAIPSGLNIYKVDMILSRIALPYSLVTDFGSLPIPFKCIATDIRNGESIELENGSLEKALRATMSIPGVFHPVEYNGRLLVDGGILNNVPVDVVKRMGADVVIAVNIASPLPKNQPENIGTIISRTLDTVTGDNVKKSICHADILIEPSITELGLYQWGAAERYIELGYQATERQKAALLKYALDEASWQQYLQERKGRFLKSAPIPQRIVIQTNSDINKTYIQNRFQKYVGEPIDTSLLEKDLTALMGSGLYEGLSYEFAILDQQPVLMIYVQEKTYGPPFIRSNLQMTFGSNESKNLIGVRMISTNVTGPNSELRLDLNLGSEPGFQAELYKRISGSRLFVAPLVFLKRVDSSLFDSNSRITDYQISNYGVNFDIGYNLYEFSEIRFGYTVEQQQTEVSVGEPLNIDYTGEVQTTHLRWTFSSADDPLLPLRGLTVNSNAVWYIRTPNNTSNYGTFENRVLWNCPAGQKNSFFVLISGGISITDDMPLPQQYKLGGLFRMGAYGFDEFHGNNYFLSSVGFLKNLTPLGSSIYLGVWVEHGGIYDHWSDSKMKDDFSIGVICPTPLGPLFICASCKDNLESVYYIGLGHFFT
jgi:NTE family protein